MTTTKTFRTTIGAGGGHIPVPFDPRPVFGKVRAPVVVTLNGHSYRSTIAVMDGVTFVPLRRSNREAARLADGGTVEVTLTLDLEPRTVEPPEDLATALQASPDAWTHWQRLSYSHQREHVEAVASAKAPATRARRIAKAVAALADAAQAAGAPRR